VQQIKMIDEEVGKENCRKLMNEVEDFVQFTPAKLVVRISKCYGRDLARGTVVKKVRQ